MELFHLSHHQSSSSPYKFQFFYQNNCKLFSTSSFAITTTLKTIIKNVDPKIIIPYFFVKDAKTEVMKDFVSFRPTSFSDASRVINDGNNKM